MEIKDSKVWAAFDNYCAWLSLPRHYSALTPEQLDEKGFPIDLIELLSIKYKKDFAAKFCVSLEMLSEWDKHPELHARIKKNWKSWCKRLTPGILGKFVDKLMVEADPARMKIWLQTIEEEKEDGNVNVNIGFANILKSMKEDGDFSEIKQEDKNNG